jgi:hypothetical protein
MLGGTDGFVEFHGQLDMTVACCDVGRSRRLVSDESALAIAKAVLGDVSPESVAGLDRDQRNEAIRKLRLAHLSVRQIERLTGVSRGVVAGVRVG